jgi:hypothetical protein
MEDILIKMIRIYDQYRMMRISPVEALRALMDELKKAKHHLDK